MNLILQVGTQADLPPVPPGKLAFSLEYYQVEIPKLLKFPMKILNSPLSS